MELQAGLPIPPGAHWDGSGVNFALFSAYAEHVELCIWEGDVMRTFPLPKCTNQVWHGYLS